MKLIKLSSDHYIIVDDSEIKIGDIIAEKLLTGKYELFEIHTLNDIDKSCQKVVTHSTQPVTNEVGNDGFEFDHNSTYPPTTVLPLSLSEVKELLGEVDVEKKAEEKYPTYDGDLLGIAYNQKYSRLDYIAGYNQALEDNKHRKYTEKDVRVAIRLATTYYDHVLEFYSEQDILQSPQPPTSWYVTFVDGKLKLK